MYFAAKKRVCDVQTFWREQKRVHKRKQLKVRGAGESGVARGPETEVLQGCQTIKKAVSCRGRVVGGGGRAVWPCVISGRGTVFFYYRQSVVHKGLRSYLPPPSLPPVLLCVRAHAHLLDWRVLSCRVCCIKKVIFFLLVRCLLVFYSVIKKGLVIDVITFCAL